MKPLEQLRSLYFLGIGGIGMSALARFFHAKGMDVAGYDRVETALTRKLENEGMQIHYTDDIRQVPEAPDLVVWTPAIPESLQEMQFLRDKKATMMKRAEVLGMISRTQKAIGVAGTHGKTTTSAMLTFLLRESGVDVSAFLGGIPRNYGSNFIAGKSDWVVMEADEYDRSFWQLYPRCAVVTSLDPDHLDIYGDHEEMIRSYRVFLEQVEAGGILIYHHSLLPVLGKGFLEKLKSSGIECISYGLGKGDAQGKILGIEDGYVIFRYRFGPHRLDQVRLRMPGGHNVLNMTAALTTAIRLGAGAEMLAEAVQEFTGIERRFEIHELGGGRYLVNDYAHHPVELEAAISAARQFFPGKRLTVVFQPHLYSRTKDFGEAFARVLDTVDRPVLVELYPAREEPIEGIGTAYILNMMNHPLKRDTTKKKLIDLLRRNEIEILMILGAGDIDVLVPDLINALKH